MTLLETTLTLIGGPTVLIELAGFRFLTDPTFDAPGVYQSSPTVTLEKTTQPALTADEVGAVDAVLLSHDQHFDNLDHAGRAFLMRARTTYTTPVAQVDWTAWPWGLRHESARAWSAREAPFM